jgi:TldD protein
VRAIAAAGQSATARVPSRMEGRALYAPHRPAGLAVEADKVALLHRLEDYARKQDTRVTQVIASLAGEYEVIFVTRLDGRGAADVRPLVRVSLQVIVEQDGRREQGSAGGGGRFDYAYFSDAR